MGNQQPNRSCERRRFNESNGKIFYQPLINQYVYVICRYMVKSLTLEQQQILKDNYGKIKAKELAAMFNVSINTIYHAAKHLKLTQKLNPVFELTPEQHQIILGGILGDGNLKKNGKNHYYRECHAIGEEDYLRWKADQLGDITTGKIFDIPGRGYSPQVGFQTKNSSTFTEYAEMNRMDVIEKIDELGFVIWLLDDGWIRKNCKSRSMGIARGTLTDEEAEGLIIKASELGLSMHCVGSKQDFSLNSENNKRIKELVYKYFDSSMDIIQKKINDLQVKDNGGL